MRRVRMTEVEYVKGKHTASPAEGTWRGSTADWTGGVIELAVVRTLGGDYTTKSASGPGES